MVTGNFFKQRSPGVSTTTGGWKGTTPEDGRAPVFLIAVGVAVNGRIPINPNEVKSEKKPDLQRRVIAATALAATRGNSGDTFNRAPLWTVDRLQKSPAKINPKSFAEIQSISGDANWALAATEY